MADFPEGQFSEADNALLTRAASCEQCLDWDDCSQSNLQNLSRAEGLELASAVLYERTLRHPNHGKFFQRVRTSSSSVLVSPPVVGIVPGAFYREHQDTGADGARVAAILRSIGLQTQCVPVESFGSLKRNAMFISEWLAKHSGERIALISLSKGSADVKTALGLPNAVEIFSNVTTWVSLSGLPCGTPLVAWLRRRWLRKLGVRILLRLRGQRYSVVEELRHELDGPLASWPTVPAQLCVIHVVAFPLRRHLTHPWAGRAYERLSPLGPNDGGGFLLSEVVRLPGAVFPVWGADHYFQPAWDATALLRRVFVEAVATSAEPLHANTAAPQPSNPPASKSIA